MCLEVVNSATELLVQIMPPFRSSDTLNVLRNNNKMLQDPLTSSDEFN